MLGSIVIKTSEDIDDDLWDELDDFHESLGEEDQKLIESKTMIDDKLVEIPIRSLQIARTLGVVQHQGRSLSNAGKAFIEYLEKS